MLYGLKIKINIENINNRSVKIKPAKFTQAKEWNKNMVFGDEELSLSESGFPGFDNLQNGPFDFIWFYSVNSDSDNSSL